MHTTTHPRGRQLVRTTIAIVATMAVAMGLLTAGPAAAHQSDTDGHVAPNTNYGFEVIGRDVLAGISDGKYTDVWSHDGYAYVGTFQNPDCDDAGVYVVDMAAAIDGFVDGDASTYERATVAQIRSAPNTRINDVKVIDIDGRDVLIATQERCGAVVPGAANSGYVAPYQNGKGGISLYDVTDPANPVTLKRNWLARYDGVHNTFPWTTDEGTFLIGVGSEDFVNDGYTDTFIADISKPQSPKLLVETGILDWLDDGALSDGQFETGTFGSINLHDVWVEEVDPDGDGTTQWQALLPYWDAGFIILDVDDPANPVFMGDSEYPATDPAARDAVGEPLNDPLPYEGNAHAGVFGGANGEYLFVGDEDFDPTQFGVAVGGEVIAASGAAYGPPSSTLAGTIVDQQSSVACTPGELAPATAADQVVLVSRGSCFFQDKADSAEAQGYAGYVVVNVPANGDTTITMGARDDAPVGIPGVMVSYPGYLTMLDAGLGEIHATEKFNGWGYFRVLNNQMADVTVDADGNRGDATLTAGYLDQLGYYAPAETLEPGFYDPDNPIGDLTMHNVEVDPTTQDVTPSFDAGPRTFVSWYSLGMRALEYRPGHYHDNANGEGTYSQNVHEVGRYIAEDGSNYWGVHVDTIDIDPAIEGEEQVILASDRNTGLWIFTFDCASSVGEGTPFYCRKDGANGG